MLLGFVFLHLGIYGINEDGFFEVKPEKKLAEKGKNAAELFCQTAKVVFYFRYLHENTDKYNLPDSRLGLDYNDKVHNKKETTKCLKFNGMDECAYIVFREIIKEHINFKLVCHISPDKKSGPILQVCGSKDTILISIKLIENKVVISTTIDNELTKALSVDLPIGSTKISLSTTSNYINIHLGEDSYKIYAELLHKPEIERVELNAVSTKDWSNNRIGPVEGIFYVHIKSEKTGKSKSRYSSKNNSDNRYLSKYGKVRELVLTGTPGMIGQGNHYLGVPFCTK